MKKIVIAAAIMSLFVVNAQAATQAEIMRGRAMNDIKVGMRLVVQAQELTAKNPASQAMIQSLDLYVEAGKLFEQAENLLISLDKRYVNPKDIEGCANYQKRCLESAQQLSLRLSGAKQR